LEEEKEKKIKVQEEEQQKKKGERIPKYHFHTTTSVKKV